MNELSFTMAELEHYFSLLSDADCYQSIMVKKRKMADEYLNNLIIMKKLKIFEENNGSVRE